MSSGNRHKWVVIRPPIHTKMKNKIASRRPPVSESTHFSCHADAWRTCSGPMHSMRIISCTIFLGRQTTRRRKKASNRLALLFPKLRGLRLPNSTATCFSITHFCLFFNLILSTFCPQNVNLHATAWHNIPRVSEVDKRRLNKQWVTEKTNRRFRWVSYPPEF